MTKTKRWSVLLAAMALAGCRQPAQQAAAPPPATPPAAPAPVAQTSAVAALPPHAGLPNFHAVDDGIYRGGAPTAEGLKSLKAMGVKTIIDLRIEKAHKQEQKTAEAMGFRWIGLPMGSEAPKPAQVKTLLDTLATPDAKPVYVHCQHGADRTGCMMGIYRVQVQGWPFEKAWLEMRKYGFKPYYKDLKATVEKAAKAAKASPRAGSTSPAPAPVSG